MADLKVREPLEILASSRGSSANGADGRGYRSRPIRRHRRSKARPKKRDRRTKAEMETIREAIDAIVSEGQPMTVRQIFYQLLPVKVIEKEEQEYKSTVVRLLVEMRLAGEIPFGWIADHTRWMRKPTTHSSLTSMLHDSVQTYRRALWDSQDAYVEVWLEKDALAGVVYEVTEEFDVPLMVTRGYPSLSFLASAAEFLEESEKPSYLYYFGDHDPSGVDIPRHVEERLRELAPSAEFEFKVVAVRPWQIEDWELPTRPTKQSDSRAKTFKGESVEVDAIPPDKLRELVRNCIEQHIDQDLLSRVRETEEAERETLRQVLAGLEGRA